MERLEEYGSEGFRAVCVLLETGHVHYRTWKLLEVTWRPGDECHLIALATLLSAAGILLTLFPGLVRRRAAERELCLEGLG